MFFSNRIRSIKKTDKVLEIGAGSSPYSRSDVFLDKKFDDKETIEQRGLQPIIKYSKPIYYYNGSKFPFKDNEFDYVICSQILEHVPENEFVNFIKEIERVAKGGYIEVPRVFYEYLFNFHVHKWLINYKEGKLILLDKQRIAFSHIQDVFYLMLRYGVKKKKIEIINDFIDLFMIGYEWKGTISYEIVDNLDELVSNEDIEIYKKYFIDINDRNVDIYRKESLIDRIFRKSRSILRRLL